MTNLPALREAVAIIQRGVPRDQAGVYDDRTPLELAALRLALALPALLDALEAERIENTRLREAVQVFEKGYNTAEADLAAARTSEKRAWDEAVQARIDGAENLMLLTHELQADLAALREPCACCREMMGNDGRCGDGCRCGARHMEEQA